MFIDSSFWLQSCSDELKAIDAGVLCNFNLDEVTSLEIL